MAEKSNSHEDLGPQSIGQTIEIQSLEMLIFEPEQIAILLQLCEAELDNPSPGPWFDSLVLNGVVDGEVKKQGYRVTFFVAEDEIFCILAGQRILFQSPDDSTIKNLRERNEKHGIVPPGQTPALFTKRSKPLSKNLAQPTFMEARATVTAISDGPDLSNWGPVAGALAMLHDRKGGRHQILFEPSTQLLNSWGNGGSDGQMKRLENELCNLEFDAILAFMVCLAGAIEQAELDTSLDGIITAIGRDKDARRSAQARALWRGKVWSWLLMFDSLSVVGVRPGFWNEPTVKGEKKKKMEPEALYSKDALLKILGSRGVDQGTLDSSAVPKEVTLVLGPWAREMRGNRQMLSEFGALRAIASIPRGKPSGAWAACAGLMLQQRWRERSADTPVIRVGQEKHETQPFKPITRRELLIKTLRSDCDIIEILDGNDPTRAKAYWNQAVSILKESGVIGHYAEVEPLPKGRQDWQKDWLDQPLDIRPGGAMRDDAIKIRREAETAKKRGRKPKPAQLHKTVGV